MSDNNIKKEGNITDHYQFICGDSYEELQKLPDNSVDSVVTDPPYGLGKPPDVAEVMKDWVEKGYHDIKGKGFMGKKWDAFIPQPRLWKECLRVLKPGGHLLSFSGTRTQDWMGMSLRFAGFEIRDSIAWVYGCFSDDTEVLTQKGWLHHNDVNLKDKILQWDKNTNKLTWTKPIRKFEYNIEDDMVLFENRHTSQLVTKNHSIFAKIRKHSRNKKPEFYEKVPAETIKKNWQIDLPLAGEYEGEINVEHPYLIGWWLTDAWRHGDGKACMFSQSKTITLNKLRQYFTSNNIHFSEYTKRVRQKNHNIEHTFYVNGNIAQYLIEKYPNREMNWDMLLWSKKHRFQLVEGLLDGDGSRNENRGYSEVFWSQKKERLDIFQALCLSLNIRSHIDYKKGCVYLNRTHNTTQLQAKHKKSLQKYKGVVWDFETETGAFVVRRNGQAFISGNSGFPKNHNIGKAVDKLQGNERKDLGLSDISRPNAKNHNNTVGGNPHNNNGKVRITKDHSEWEGWGTALKPALEPIIMARKPASEKSIAENVLKWGTGGINIDECRVKFSDVADEAESKGKNQHSRYKNSIMRNPAPNGIYHKDTRPPKDYVAQGRFPANLIHDGSEEVIGLFPNKVEGKDNFKHSATSIFGSKGKTNNYNGNSKSSWGSAARFFYCAKASPKERNFGLEDEQETTTDDGRKKKIDNAFQRGKTLRNNNHPTVKPVRLMRYLTKLVTPPEGVVLDPFMGSGTTGIGCKENGFGFIGIDNVEDYIKLSKKRIINWPVGWLDKTQKKKNKNTKKKNKEKVGKNNDILNKFFDYGQ